MKLSPYTIAKNCTDLADIKAGIDELMQYLDKTKKPCSSAYIRWYKLKEKETKFLTNK